MAEPNREKISLIEPTAAGDPLKQLHSDLLVHHHNFKSDGVSRTTQPGPNMGRSLGQIFIILVVLLVLVNIPFNSASAGLAQLMPHSASIVIQDGMLLKGSGPQIYVVDNYKVRRVSTEAMQKFFGPRRVNRVEDSLLAQFGQGPPVQYLLQCRTKPDIYAVEDGYKRRVAIPPTNSVQVWDKVHFVSCHYLERLPDGPPLP